MRKPIFGRVLLVVGALASRTPLDQLGWPNVAIIAAMLGLVMVACYMTADLNRIESSITTAILVAFTLTAAHAFSGWLSISYLRAFLGACFWVCVVWSLLWMNPLALDAWDRRSNR